MILGDIVTSFRVSRTRVAARLEMVQRAKLFPEDLNQWSKRKLRGGGGGNIPRLKGTDQCLDID